MLMGFLGCLGAIYEIRCLLGLVSDESVRSWSRFKAVLTHSSEDLLTICGFTADDEV